VWWGFALSALGSGTAAWPTLIGPLLITFILTRVTVPMLERHFLKRHPEAYQSSITTTNYFIPKIPHTNKY